MNINYKEMYNELFQITIKFLNKPLEILELWNMHKEYFHGELKEYINYQFNSYIEECNLQLLIFLLNYKINNLFLSNNLIDITEVIYFFVSAAKDIALFNEVDIKECSTQFYNKLFNIKFDEAKIIEGGYILYKHIDNENTEEHNLKLIK